MPNDVKFTLLKCKVNSLTFKSKSEAPQGEIPINFGISHKYKYDYKNKTIAVLLSASVNDEQMPFFIEIEYEGLFVLNKRVSKKAAEPIAQINCSAILFPFLREAVAEITRRGGFNPLMLPTINFFQAAKKREAKAASQLKDS